MIFGRTPYHFAICVDDLDAEWLEISRRFDMRLGDPVEGDCRLRTGTGIEFSTTVRSAWSKGTYPALEVTQAIPGTIWTAASAIHHVGIWADDLAELTARCLSAGATVELDGGLDDELLFRYVRLPGGLRVELVSEALRPTMDALVGDTA